MPKQPRLRPKSNIPGFPDAIYGFSTLSSLSQLESRIGLSEEKPDQRVFRVKRKHVLKACDRCRVKKTKCDGKQPCNRCSAYNHPCLFRERKATQTKVYSRGFVEMLESHHSLVVKALQRLYKLCIKKEGFPGEPLVEAPDGYPLTHAILDRLGLIKQAEESSEDADKETEELRYLRLLANSTDYSATTDPSPDPATPSDPSPNNCSPVHLSPRGSGPFKWEFHPVQQDQRDQYHNYQQAGFQGIMLPRPVLDSMSVSNETKCTEPMPRSVTNHEQPYLYYTESRCNGESANPRLQPIVTSESGSLPAGTTAGIPVDMIGDYNLHLQGSQPIYPSLSSGWTYPCG